MISVPTASPPVLSVSARSHFAGVIFGLFTISWEVMMNKYLCVLWSAGIVFAATACSSAKDKEDWQQYRAKKSQEEMAADVAKQKSEAEKK
jgi:hypothetical protein